MMAASIVDAPNVEGIVNNPVTRHLQRLDGQVDIAEKFPFACGRHADIYLGRVPSDMQNFIDHVCFFFFLCPHNFAHNFYLAPPLAREVVSQHFNGSISADER